MKCLPYGEYYSVKHEIITECHISSDIWKNWLSGRTLIPELAKPIIKAILDNKIAEKNPHNRLQLTLNM